MSALRNSSGASRASSVGAVAVLIDPFWVGNIPLNRSVLNQVEKLASHYGQLLRIYWYLDNYPKELEGFEAKHTTVRVLGRDDLEDGFELIKAIDSDLTGLSTHGLVSTIILGSLDDRLLLSVERIKHTGHRVVGLLSPESKNDEGSARMLHSFDDTVQLSGYAAESDREMTAEEEALLNGVVNEWLPTQDESALDYIRQYITNRPGIPREVDSRLLFLSSRVLHRELSNAEKIHIRNLVRSSVAPA